MKQYISIFKNVRMNDCDYFDANLIVREIISEKHKHRVEPIREVISKVQGDYGNYKAAKEAANKKKRNLPAIIWTGKFQGRTKLINHSGLLCIDIDGTNETTRETVNKLGKHPSVYAAFVSPSGNGVKAVFRVIPDEKKHDASWRSAANLVQELTSHKADESAKDIGRLCFVSHDPEAYHNPSAVELEITDAKEGSSKVNGQPSKLVTPEMLVERKQIAEKLLGEVGWKNATEGYCECPNAKSHTTPNGQRDCRVSLDGTPTVSCFHNHCRTKINAINVEFRREVGKAEANCDESLWFVLPSQGGESITESAQKIFAVIAPTNTLFQRGGQIVRPKKDDFGNLVLREVKPTEFRSTIESYGKTVGSWLVRKSGMVLKKDVCSEEKAKALIASAPAQNLLPKISILLNSPALAEDNGKLTLLAPGYNDVLGGVFVAGGKLPLSVPLNEAVSAIKELLVDFNFKTPSDKSRAIALLLSPAMRFGGLIEGHFPLDVAEADQSQSGKGYRHQVWASIYGEQPQVFAQRKGGVGGFEEDLGQAILRGRPFIQCDNVRGDINSQTFVSVLTCDGPFSVRGFRQKSTEVDVRRFNFQLSSNNWHTTEDLVNRAMIVSIQKQPSDYEWKTYDEGKGELLRHVKNNQPYYLGCTHSVIREWHQRGKPRSSESRHSFREWVQIMDWIVQEIFGESPLIDDTHEATKNRITSPAQNTLRTLAICLEREGRLELDLSATDIALFCQENSIEVFGRKLSGEDKDARAIGSMFKSEFNDKHEISVEQFTITKREEESKDEESRLRIKKTYTFKKREEQEYENNLDAKEPQKKKPKPCKLVLAEFDNPSLISKALELFRGRQEADLLSN